MALDDLPEVPQEQRPQKLYVNVGVDESVRQTLIAKGWLPIDVRILPNKTDGDRSEAFRAYLEGLRIGSILPDPKLKPFLEMEARSYGLHAMKASELGSKHDEDATELDVDQLLTLKSPRSFRGTKLASDGSVGVKSAKELLSRPKRK